MSWNRDRFNREDDERDYGYRSRSRQWDRDFDAQSNPQGSFQTQGRGFEGDYGYGRDFDYQRGMNMGNQGRYYGGTDYGRGMGNDFYTRGNYGQGMAPDFGRGFRGDWSQNPNFGYERDYGYGGGTYQGRNFGGSFNRDYDYDYGSYGSPGQFRGGWPRGGDFDYTRGYGGYQEGEWAPGSNRFGTGRSWSSDYGYQGQGNFGRGFRSRNWGQGQPDYTRDFGSNFGYQGRRFGGFGDYDYDYDQFGSPYSRTWQGRGSFGGGFNQGRNQGPYFGRGPQGWQRSDERIREDVNEALTQHGWLDATGIQVSVNKGDVTLNGTVDSRYAKRMAEDALEDISGIMDVHNNLRVEMGDEGTRARNESFAGTSGRSTGSTSTPGTTGTTGGTRTKERSTT